MLNPDLARTFEMDVEKQVRVGKRTAEIISGLGKMSGSDKFKDEFTEGIQRKTKT